jgi:hypothetical protein
MARLDRLRSTGAAIVASALYLAMWLAPSTVSAQELEVEGVVVAGKASPIAARVNAYVRAAAVKEFGESLVRWHNDICPLIAGLPKDQGEYVLARFSQIANQTGAPLAKAKCKPNLYIVVTGDPKALLKAWKKRDSNLFGHELPPRIDRFIATDRPIRVWHNWAFEHWADNNRSTLAGRRRQQPEEGRLENSRMVSSVTRRDWGAIVIVDTAKTQDLSVGQLADFVTMTTLCEFDLDTSLGSTPTILSLFQTSGADRPNGLSAWDLALLKALYATDQQSKLQPSLIASRILRDLSR